MAALVIIIVQLLHGAAINRNCTSCYVTSDYHLLTVTISKSNLTPTSERKISKFSWRNNGDLQALLERWIDGIWNWEQKSWMWGGTGKPLKYQGFPRKSRFNGNNNWHCIAMDPSILYRWKSASCLEQKHFICETPLRNVGSKPKDMLVVKPKKRNRKKGKGRKKGRKQSITNNNTV